MISITKKIQEAALPDLPLVNHLVGNMNEPGYFQAALFPNSFPSAGSDMEDMYLRNAVIKSPNQCGTASNYHFLTSDLSFLIKISFLYALRSHCVTIVSLKDNDGMFVPLSHIVDDSLSLENFHNVNIFRCERYPGLQNLCDYLVSNASSLPIIYPNRKSLLSMGFARLIYEASLFSSFSTAFPFLKKYFEAVRYTRDRMIEAGQPIELCFLRA